MMVIIIGGMLMMMVFCVFIFLKCIIEVLEIELDIIYNESVLE